MKIYEKDTREAPQPKGGFERPLPPGFRAPKLVAEDNYDRLTLAQSYVEDATRGRIDNNMKHAMFSIEVALTEVIIYLEELRGSPTRTKLEVK